MRNIGKTLTNEEYATCIKIPVQATEKRYEEWHDFLDNIGASKWNFSWGVMQFTNENDAMMFKLAFGHHRPGQ